MQILSSIVSFASFFAPYELSHFHSFCVYFLWSAYVFQLFVFLLKVYAYLIYVNLFTTLGLPILGVFFL